MIINNENALNITKALWVLYNNYPLFTYSIKNQICTRLLSRTFFRLFCHWSPNVRQIFHNFMIYRIYHEHI